MVIRIVIRTYLSIFFIGVKTCLPQLRFGRSEELEMDGPDGYRGWRQIQLNRSPTLEHLIYLSNE